MRNHGLAIEVLYIYHMLNMLVIEKLVRKIK